MQVFPTEEATCCTAPPDVERAVLCEYMLYSGLFFLLRTRRVTSPMPV